MNIRKALNKDIDVIARYNYNLAYETENKILDMNILTKGVEAIIKDENKGIYHVCEINGEVVGQIMYTFEWSDWRNGTFLWIQSAYVNKEFRGMGVFKALYKFIRDIADNDNNICGIRLYVEKENTIAKKTYKNIGMKECNYYIYEYDKE
ncbi:N-acetyltransferase family protein [Clostridium sp.]